jgi:hypothetical protein
MDFCHKLSWGHTANSFLFLIKTLLLCFTIPFEENKGTKERESEKERESKYT